MSKRLTSEAADLINQAVEEVLRQHPGASEFEEPLRALLRKRWPFILRSITVEAST
jgi:hypothetical protein